MFKKLISQGFKTLAARAVESAEINFGPGKGVAKKRYAINFMLARLPIPVVFLDILGGLLVEVLDLAIEKAHEKFADV